ncbi:hypothetical protein ACKFKG_05875 [Phormidesmis sp. 146-35]
MIAIIEYNHTHERQKSMTIDPTFIVPDSISFEEAIALTQSLLSKIEQEGLSESDAATVANLVATENGARGFFVTYLTDARPLADRPSEEVVAALRSSPSMVSELLVKNLAMSTAMILAHTRSQKLDLAKGSERVQQRTTNLIQQTQLAEVQTKVQSLLESIASGTGQYQSFLERWGYDAEQKQAIAQALQQVVT